MSDYNLASMALSDEQGNHVPVDSSLRTRNLPPFGPSESLVDDFPGFESPNASTVSLSQPQVDVTKRLSWSPPACYVEDYTDPSDIQITDLHDFHEYFQHDLDLRMYEEIQKYIWWASLSPRPSAIHEFILRGHSLCLTQDHDEHDVQKKNIVFLKPLPDYLLCHTVWDLYLCNNDELYANAIGLLRSYMILVRSKLDFKMAQDKLLIPTEITWQQWSAFSHSCISNCPLRSCNPRYWYRTLVESRLTWIYRFTQFSFTDPYNSIINRWVKGTYSQSNFIQENTRWLLAALIYVTIVLTTMQVGLATDQLEANKTFTRACYGFTLFSILAPLAILLPVIAISLLQTWLLFLHDLRERKNIRERVGT